MRDSIVRIGKVASFLLLTAAVGLAQNWFISRYAGPPAPQDGAAAITQSIEYATSVAPDGTGGFYVASRTLNRIYRVLADGTLRLVAGTGIAGYGGDGGSAILATLHQPYGIALDAGGNLYIADYRNHRVRRVTAAGIISTVAGTGTAGHSGDGGPATSASLGYPQDVAVDGSGNLLIASSGYSRIRRVTPGGIISTVAGTGSSGYSGDGGPATSAQLFLPQGVAVGLTGDFYIADTYNHRIRRVDSSGVISTVAGTGTSGSTGDGGPATSAQLNLPADVTVDAAGNLFIADESNHLIRRVTPAGVISTFAGTGEWGYGGDGGAATLAKLFRPSGVSFDTAGNLYIADSANDRVRRVTPAGVISTIGGTSCDGYGGDGGAAAVARLAGPRSIALDSTGRLYIADYANHRIRRVTAAGVISTMAGTGIAGHSGDGGAATLAKLSSPAGVAVDSSGSLYIADSGNNRIRRVTFAGVISTVAGDGTSSFGGDGGQATSAQLSTPTGVAVDAAGNVYIADTFNQRIRRVTSAGVISTIAGIGTAGYDGDNGPATLAQLNQPYGVAVDAAGNVYIADTYNYRIRRVTAAGTISTVAGTGAFGSSGDGGPATSAQLNLPYGVTADADGNLYISDSANQRIRRVTAAGIINTVAGIGTYGFSGDGRPATLAQLFNPRGVAVGTAGSFYISEYSNDRIRKVRVLRPAWDADADAKTDTTVWRPSTGFWYVRPSASPGAFTGTQWGISTDVPVPGDYDGDGKSDVAVWRPSNGFWYVLPSASPGNAASTQWGSSGDIPVPGDYDGDGKTDIAVWRPSSGMWYVIPSAPPGMIRMTLWGMSGDIPVPGDYDGDGKTDIAVWRPSSGIWYVVSSGSSGTITSTLWGVSGDVPVAGDYDGDGKTDIAVWRTSSGIWYLLPSDSPGTFKAVQWGQSGDMPVPGYYDGDGFVDVAIWRSGSGTWYCLPSGSPGSFTSTQWGIPTDYPISRPLQAIQ